MFRRMMVRFKPLETVSVSKSNVTHNILTIDSLHAGLDHATGIYCLSSSSPASASSSATGSSQAGSFAVVETANSHSVPVLEKTLKDQYGASLAAIKWIVVTHAHLDHCAGAGTLLTQCPQAQVLCHPRARKHLIDPSALLASAKKVYTTPESFSSQVGKMVPCPEGKVRAMEDGEELDLNLDLIGEGGGTTATTKRTLKFHHSLGHAKHHMFVEDLETKSIFSGDNFGCSCDRIGYRDIFFPATAPIDFDAKEAVNSIEKILACKPDRVYPTHFSFTEKLDSVAAQLKRQLTVYEEARVLSSYLIQSGADPMTQLAPVVASKFVDCILDEVRREDPFSEDPIPVDRDAHLAAHIMRDDFLKGNMLINTQGVLVAAGRRLVNMDNLPSNITQLLQPMEEGTGPSKGYVGNDPLKLAVRYQLQAENEEGESLLGISKKAAEVLERSGTGIRKAMSKM